MFAPTRPPQGLAILADHAAHPFVPQAVAGAGLATVLAAILLMAASCSHNARDRAAAPSATIDVRTARPVGMQGAGAIVLPARVKAEEEVTLTARVPGRLTALPFQEGARFRRGQSLAAFDAPEAREALASARAGLAAATSRRDRARIQEARIESLYTVSVVSKSDLELAQVDRQAADAAFAAARATLAEWDEGTTLPAPFDGVVVRRHADPGQMLQPGMPLLDLRSNAAREILAAVPESELGALAGARLEVQVGESGPWSPARLARVDGMTDPATRTRVAHVLPAASDVALEPGAFARVRIERARGAARAAGDSVAPPSRLAIPETSLVRRGALAGVFVVEDGHARLRWLRLGRVEAGQAEVLAGLWPTDEVALEPGRLTDGQPVRVTR